MERNIAVVDVAKNGVKNRKFGLFFIFTFLNYKKIDIYQNKINSYLNIY